MAWIAGKEGAVLKPLVVDSSVWLEFFGGGPLAAAAARYLEDPGDLITPAIVLYEVYKKTKHSQGEENAVSVAAQLGKTTVVDLNASIALLAADLSLARKLAMADAIVLATARSYDAELVTLDPDFKGIEGVVVLTGSPKKLH